MFPHTVYDLKLSFVVKLLGELQITSTNQQFGVFGQQCSYYYPICFKILKAFVGDALKLADSDRATHCSK